MNLNKKMESSKQYLIQSYLQTNCTSQCIPIKCFLDNIEKEMIGKALKIARGNQKVASLILGLKPTTLNEKIRKFNIRERRKIASRQELKSYLSEIDFSSI